MTLSLSSSRNQPKPNHATKLGASKAKEKDRHVKVCGQDRRVRIPTGCAARVFQLSQVLGHRTRGQTVDWLLKQAETAVNQVLGIATSTAQEEVVEVAIPKSAPITPRAAISPPRPAVSPSLLPPLPASVVSPISLEVEDLSSLVESQGPAAPGGDFVYDLNPSGNGLSEFTIEDFANMPLVHPIYFYGYLSS